MPPVSVDTLRAPSTCQVFSLSAPLSAAAAEQALSIASSNASGRRLGRIVRNRRTTGNIVYWCSFICFPLEGSPSFMPDAGLVERRYGFALLIETQVSGTWFVAILTDKASSLGDWIEERAITLPRTRLTNAFAQNAAVSKMRFKRMTVSQHELRGATLEAHDLQSSMPMMAAGRCAIQSLRFRDEHRGTIGVTLSTSRVRRSGSRATVDQLAQIVNDVAVRVQSNVPHGFLSTFAQAIPIRDLPATAGPAGILFDWTAILDDDALRIHRKGDNGQQHGEEVSKKLLTRLLGESFPLSNVTGPWNFGAAGSRGTISRTSTKFSVRSLLGGHLVVHDTRNNETVPLAKWVRDSAAYSIAFTDPHYFYTGDVLYHRSSFSQEVESVRRCLVPEQTLVGAGSEKGKPAPLPTAAGFSADSIFGICEQSIYRNRDWMCCTDLGDEWADYLCLRSNTVIFVHCKHGSETTGATSFQEVVGQALKNLGRAHSTPAELRSKLTAQRALRYWGGTAIERLRPPGTSWNAFEARFANLLADPDSSREVHLVVTMLSAAEFDIAAARPTPSAHFVQLIWLLASFANSCREMGAKPVIICTT